MLQVHYASKVGVAPSTTTIAFGAVGQEVFVCDADLGQGASALTVEQWRGEDIALRTEQLRLQSRDALWTRLGTIAQASLATLALGAVVIAWVRTGRLNVKGKPA